MFVFRRPNRDDVENAVKLEAELVETLNPHEETEEAAFERLMGAVTSILTIRNEYEEKLAAYQKTKTYLSFAALAALPYATALIHKIVK